MSWWEAFVWGDLDRRCPARPADRGLLLLDSLLHGGHLVCARKPPREGLAALAARNKAHCQYTVKFWRQCVVIRHRPQRSSRPCGRRPPGQGAETAPLPAPFWCTIPVEPAHFDWRSRERPALALLAWEALSRDPMAGLRRIQAESIGTTINFARSLLRLQPELGQAAAEPVTQREATAATSHGLDPPAQSHCYFPLALSRVDHAGGSA